MHFHLEEARQKELLCAFGGNLGLLQYRDKFSVINAYRHVKQYIFMNEHLFCSYKHVMEQDKRERLGMVIVNKQKSDFLLASRLLPKPVTHQKPIRAPR